MKNKKIFCFIAAALTAALSGCTSSASADDNVFQPEAKNDVIITSVPGNSEMRVSFIDVGQADSEFIELPNGETMLIDAGTNETGANAVNYIKSLGYTSIDYVVGTHPHEDHIGGLDDIINTFDIGKVYMPKVTADTKTFEDVLDAVDAKGLTINTAKAGVTILDTERLSIKMLAPISDSYENTNDYSAVIKIVYGDTSFLFTGDAEVLAEKQITDDVSADVLKIGHHGSSTSTCDEFLDKVSPKIAVISCGKDNKYGHPNKETLDKLNARGIPYYRTDKLGTITVMSDGQKVWTDNTASESQAPVQTAESEQTAQTYVLNTNSKRIHTPDCTSVAKMSDKNKAYTNDYDKAISEGYEPCSVCNPKG